MVDSPKTCVDPYLDSFTQSFAAANYKAGTIKNYLHLVRKLGRLMDATGIEPSALSPDLADQLARTAARGPASKIRLHNLARQFTEHLINIGVAQPVPVSAAQVARTALLADLEAYLIKQRVSVRAPSASAGLRQPVPRSSLRNGDVRLGGHSRRRCHRLRCVPGMLNSSEVKVLYPT